MSKKIPFISPVGLARYPHITSPDETGKYADGKYKVQLLVNKADATQFVEFLKKTAKEHGVDKLPFKEDAADSSTLVFVAKSKYKPMIVDAKRNEVKRVDLRVAGGSKLRMGGIVYPYDKGITLQLKQVQILELVDGQDSMFDEMEGSFDITEFDSSSDGRSNTVMFDEANGLDI